MLDDNMHYVCRPTLSHKHIITRIHALQPVRTERPRQRGGAAAAWRARRSSKQQNASGQGGGARRADVGGAASEKGDGAGPCAGESVAGCGGGVLAQAAEAEETAAAGAAGNGGGSRPHKTLPQMDPLEKKGHRDEHGRPVWRGRVEPHSKEACDYRIRMVLDTDPEEASRLTKLKSILPTESARQTAATAARHAKNVADRAEAARQEALPEAVAARKAEHAENMARQEASRAREMVREAEAARQYVLPEAVAARALTFHGLTGTKMSEIRQHVAGKETEGQMFPWSFLLKIYSGGGHNVCVSGGGVTHILFEPDGSFTAVGYNAIFDEEDKTTNFYMDYFSGTATLNDASGGVTIDTHCNTRYDKTSSITTRRGTFVYDREKDRWGAKEACMGSTYALNAERSTWCGIQGRAGAGSLVLTNADRLAEYRADPLLGIAGLDTAPQGFGKAGPGR